MYRKPLPSSPMRSSTGTCRSSMKSSFDVTALRPILSMGRMSTADRSRVVKKSDIPSVFFSTSSNRVVRVRRRIFSDSWALEIHTFLPLTR